MKNYLTHIVLTACLLAACQQEDIPEPAGDDSRIRFAAPAISLETGTRSTTTDALTEGAFGVMGYCVPYILNQNELSYSSGTSEWSIKYRSCPPNVFYNQKVSISADGCQYDSPRYWYKEGYDVNGSANREVPAEAEDYRYTFFAYYPYNTDTESGFTIEQPDAAGTRGAPKFVFTMPQTGSDINTQLEHASTPDAMFGVLYNRQRSEGSLKFNFSHMLTALGFEINNFSDQQLTVYSVTLSGTFFKQIVLDFSAKGVWDSSPGTMFPDEYYTGTYTLYGKSDPLVLKAPVTGQERTTCRLPQGADGTPEYILLISGKAPYFGPVSSKEQETAERQLVEVTIKYRLGKEEGTFSSGRPSTFIPRPGTKYTAQLNFVGNAFVLQFTVDNHESWEDGGSDNGDGILFE